MAVSHEGQWQSFIALDKDEDTGDTSTIAPASDESPCCVLSLQLFAQQPTLDYGAVAVGSRSTLYLRAENPTLLNQHVAADKVPVQEGFSLSGDPDLPGAASLNWSASVAPHSSILLPVTWQPSAAGAMSKLLVFKLDRKHRLQVKLLGKAVVEAKQARQLGDQAMRQIVRRTNSGIDAPAGPQSRGTAGRAAAGFADGHEAQQRQLAAAARAPAAGTAGVVAAVAATQKQADQGKFKVPPRPSAKSASGLRLKAPTANGVRAGTTSSTAVAAAAAHKAGLTGITASRPASAGGAAARPARPTSAGSLQASRSEAMLSPASPSGSLAPGQLAAEFSSPAMLGGSVKSYCTSSRPPSKGAINRSGRPVSGSSIGGSARKVPSSARKTFKFFHTELWMNKQDRAFTGWLNHLLLPYTPEYLRAASEGDTSAALTDLRLAARVQGAMLACYRNDAELRETMMKVESAVDADKLRMKPEGVLFGDLVQRQQALQVLMGYNPFWLSLAVEVVTHKPFKLEAEAAAGSGPGTPGMKRQPGYTESMKGYLMREVLSDPDMVADLEAGRGAAHFNMDEYLRNLGALILKRFLLLVMLLDRAATNLSGKLPTPLLFKLDAPVKESSKVLFEFLHGRLVGEGGLVKHLQHLGYRLAYVQSPLMEYPFAVTNLAVDLRDGLRMIKVAEALTGDSALLTKARFPADRRPMQVYNTSLALTALKEAGVPLSALPTTSGLVALKPEDIVDGDRERTLSLLWATARTLQLASVLKVNTLKAEVQRVLARTHYLGVQPLLTAVGGVEGRRQVPGRQQALLQVYMQDELLNTLMDWVQAVCRSYGVPANNFTSCFADGVVLCLLVHYYLPNAVDLPGVYLPKQRKQELTGNGMRLTDDAGESTEQETSEVWGTASGTVESVVDGESNSMPWGRSWRGDFDASDFMEDPAVEDSRGIAGNYKTVHRAAKALGAVPEMLSSRDHAEHGPDERAVILYVAFLCSRLLDCSKDDRAAHIIQRAWRQYKSKAAGMARAHLNSWVAAATVIQSSVRAWLMRRRLYEMLAEHRAAAVALQSCWRGRCARGQQQQQQKAAVLIQHCWRKSLARRQAQQQQAALVIQKCWQAYKQRKADAWMAAFLNRCLEACQALKQTRHERLLAATNLQATWRMVLARRRFLAATAAAVKVQTAWRAHQQQRRYQQQHSAAITIQAMWHGYQQRLQYTNILSAAVTLQAAYQGLKVRTAIKQSHAFAVFLQSCCRCRHDRAAFLRLRRAALVVQASMRGWQVRRRVHQLEQACVVAQAVWRGRTVRSSIQQQHTAATVIQAAWRSRRAVSAYKQQKAAVTSIQTAWRCFTQRQAHQHQIAAAVTLQSMFRGKQTRASIQQMSTAVTIIAAAWRATVAARQCSQQLQLVVQLQALVRGHLVCQSYQQQKAAATIIQAAYRGWTVRQQVQQQHQAAVVIQSYWRREVQQQAYQGVLSAAVSLQAAVRGQQAHTQYTSRQSATLLLQSSWRARHCRSLLAQHKAAATIQAHWRRFSAQQQLQHALRAAVFIQSCWRSHKQQLGRAQAVAAAITLQAAVRAHRARSKHQAVQAAALVVQSAWRCWDSRQQLLQHRAARAIQCCWRRYKAMRQLQQHKAARTMQCCWKRHKALQEFRLASQAACTIQAQYRCHMAQHRYQQLQAAAIVVQAMARGRVAAAALQAQQLAALILQSSWRVTAARKLLQQHRAAACIQAHVRGWILRRQVATQVAAATRIRAAWLCHRRRQQYLAQHAAVVVLQAHAHGALVRKQLKQQRSAAVVIQACWRGLQCRRQCAQQQAAATLLQAAYRRHMQRQNYLQQLFAATALQAMFRGHRVRQQLAVQHAAATRLQAAFRGWAVRQELQQQTDAAVSIQAAWRCHCQQRQYQTTLQAVVKVQAAWRSYRAAASYQQLQLAAIALQAAIKGQQARSLLQMQQLTAAAVTLQSMCRGFAVRRECAKQAAAALVIQRYARGMAGRKRAKAKKDYLGSAKELQNMLLMLRTRSRAATTIAATWRGYCQRQKFLPVWHAYLQENAARVLQQAWRCKQARALLSKLQQELPQRRARATWQKIITAARGAVWQQQLEAAAREEAILVIQSAVRGWQVRRVTSRQLAGIRRLQALWRGYKVRKSCGRASRDARRRLAAAVSAPPRRTIGVRTREALDVLLASKQCSQVITAVAAIEFSTRYSKACCQLMVDSEGIKALLEFMRSCNRSKPHMEMLGHALACLANICRWPDLLQGVLHAPDCVMVLSERLQMFRDTEDIFMATVGILSALARTDEGALSVAQSAPTAVKLWEQINQLLQRKMEMERKYIERLEGQKGSDVTAREATRKLVSAATQVDALQQVIERVDSTAAAHGIEVVHHQTKQALPAADPEDQALVPRSAHVVVQPNLWQPKNTIVRGTFRETVATRAGASAAAAAAAAAAAGKQLSNGSAAVADVVAAVQQLSADQSRSDQSHKQHRLH